MVAELPSNISPGPKLSLSPPANLAQHLTRSSILGFPMLIIVFRRNLPALAAAQTLRAGKEAQGKPMRKAEAFE